jgi:hypothetical protein
MRNPVNNRRMIQKEIENNLDLWREVDLIVATHQRKVQRERGSTYLLFAIGIVVWAIVRLMQMMPMLRL